MNMESVFSHCFGDLAGIRLSHSKSCIYGNFPYNCFIQKRPQTQSRFLQKQDGGFLSIGIADVRVCRRALVPEREHGHFPTALPALRPRLRHRTERPTVLAAACDYLKVAADQTGADGL